MAECRHPHDYANMTVEVVAHSSNGDLIARTVETGRHLAISYIGSTGLGDTIDPAFLRLKAKAYMALADCIEG